MGSDSVYSPLGTSIGTSEIDDGAVTDLKLNSRSLIEHDIEIIELQANAVVSPFSHDTLISDSFSDSTGYNNLVQTGTTTAEYQQSKRQYAVTPTYTEKDSRTQEDQNLPLYDANGNILRGFMFTTTSAYVLNKIIVKFGTKIGEGCKVQVDLYSDTGATAPNALLASFGSLEASEITASAENTFYGSYSCSDATKYWVIITPVNGFNATKDWNLRYKDADAGYSRAKNEHGSGWVVTANSGGYLRVYGGAAGTTKLIDLSLGTITGSVIASELVVNAPNRESGDNITYKIKNATENDADLAANTQNIIVNLTSVPTGIEINLIPKGTSPTPNYPSIKSLALKLWKS